MATTKSYNSRKAFMDYYVYVPLGATNAAFDKAKGLAEKAWTTAQERRKAFAKTYEDLAKRGEKLAKGIQRSAYTERAIDQTKTARSQMKAAATSVRKAAGSTATATRAAARKVG